MFRNKKRDLPPHLHHDFQLFADDDPQAPWYGEETYREEAENLTSADTPAHRVGLTTLEALELIRVRFEQSQMEEGHTLQQAA